MVSLAYILGLAFTIDLARGMGIPYHRNTADDCDPMLTLNKEVTFHGIAYDVTRLESILAHGILSELASNDIGDPYFVRNTAGHEQRVNIISHPQSHSAHARGYETYIQDGISFIIQPGIITREPSNSNRASIDHLEAGYRVPLDEILGIMVPEDALGMKISDLPLGFRNMRTRSILSRLRAIIEYLRVKHHYEVPEGDELMDMLADPAIDETVTDSDEGAVTRLRLEHLIAKHIEIAFARTFDMSTGQLTLRIVVHRLARAANKCLAYNDIEYVAREESEHEDSEDDYSDWGEEEEDQGFFSRL